MWPIDAKKSNAIRRPAFSPSSKHFGRGSGRIPVPELPALAVPTFSIMHDVSTQTDQFGNAKTTGNDTSGGAHAPEFHTTNIADPESTTMVASVKLACKRRASNHCRTCGKVVKEWKAFHVVPPREQESGDRHSTRFLPKLDGHRPDQHCTVPEEQREEGFPLRQGTNFPKKKRLQ
jgi:hypothetical protein